MKARVVLAVVVATLIGSAPAQAAAFAWKGPGWYVLGIGGFSDMVYGGPYAERAQCRAKADELTAQYPKVVTYYCRYHPPDDQKIVWHWNGPGWYVIDLTMPGVLHGGPFAERDACEAAMSAPREGDAEFVASCMHHEPPAPDRNWGAVVLLVFSLTAFVWFAVAARG
jgi:hypothetical protein